MVEISEKEYKQFQTLKKVWVHLQAEKFGTYFICGEGGDKDKNGLPEFVSICPAYGTDFSITYRKHKDYK